MQCTLRLVFVVACSVSICNTATVLYRVVIAHCRVDVWVVETAVRFTIYKYTIERWRLIALNANQVEWHKIKCRSLPCKSDAFGLEKHISTVCESDICQSDRKYAINECSSSWVTITPASTCYGKIYAHMSRHFVVLLLHSFVVQALRTCYSFNSNELSAFNWNELLCVALELRIYCFCHQKQTASQHQPHIVWHTNTIDHERV